MLLFFISQIINEEIFTGVKKSFKPEGSYQWNLSGWNLRSRPEKWHVCHVPTEMFFTHFNFIPLMARSLLFK